MRRSSRGSSGWPSCCRCRTGLRPVAEPYVLLGDTCIIGFFFIAGTVFFEKQERTLGAVISTPLRFWEYLSAKLAVLVLDFTVRRSCGADDRAWIRIST